MDQLKEHPQIVELLDTLDKNGLMKEKNEVQSLVRKRLIPTPTGKAKDGAEATRPIIRFPVVSCLPLTK